MPSLYTEIEIHAPKAQVWQALFQKEKWMYWNTFLYDLDAEQPFMQGREVLLSLRRIPGEEETEFQPRVMLVQPEACLRWLSSIPGLQIEHCFELVEVGQSVTRYTHREYFSGWLTRVFLPFIRKDEQQGMRRMAWELKQYVEQQSVLDRPSLSRSGSLNSRSRKSVQNSSTQKAYNRPRRTL